MSFSGSLIQNAIYIAQQPPEWPVASEDWERAAEEKLDPGAFGYIAGGAGRGVDDAREPRRVRAAGGSARGCSPGTPCGTSPSTCSALHSPAPFLLAPVGVLSIAHEEAEVGGRRRRAASSGVPMLLSSAATHSIEEVAERRDAPRWFQLYWVNDREICASFVRRAEAAGYGAIVVTLDTLDARLAARATCARRTCRSSRARAAGSTSPTRSSSRGSTRRRRRTCSPRRRRCSRRSRTSA